MPYVASPITAAHLQGLPLIPFLDVKQTLDIVISLHIVARIPKVITAYIGKHHMYRYHLP